MTFSELRLAQAQAQQQAAQLSSLLWYVVQKYGTGATSALGHSGTRTVTILATESVAGKEMQGKLTVAPDKDGNLTITAHGVGK